MTSSSETQPHKTPEVWAVVYDEPNDHSEFKVQGVFETRELAEQKVAEYADVKTYTLDVVEVPSDGMAEWLWLLEYGCREEAGEVPMASVDRGKAEEAARSGMADGNFRAKRISNHASYWDDDNTWFLVSCHKLTVVTHTKSAAKHA